MPPLELVATRQGILVAACDADTMALIRKELTVCPKALPGAPRPPSFAMYEQVAPRDFVVPHHWALRTFPGARLRDERRPGALADFYFRGTLKASMRQPEAVEATVEALRATGGAVMSLATGQGKTVCSLAVAARIQSKLLVVVSKDFLATQWHQRIATFMPGSRVTHIQGPVCDMSGHIVVAMIQTLISRPWSKRAFDDFGMLIFDECHHVAAKAFGTCMRHLNLPYVLGLTATPVRRDGLSIFHHLGDLAFQPFENKRNDVTVRTFLYTCAAYKLPPPTNRMGALDHAALLARLADDMERTRLIVNLATSEELADRDILILSHRRTHCEDICRSLVARGVDAATYLGGKKTSSSPPSSRIIVATYALVSEGFDEPRLTALVLATPGSDVTQAVGRVMRGAATIPPLIYDVQDAWGPCFAQATRRRAQYAKAGFAITKGNVPQKKRSASFAFVADE
jgi:superfamily II DNA or RNA helicase